MLNSGAGFYPQILRVEAPPAKYQKVDGGTARVDHTPQSLRHFERTLGRVFIHPSSVCFSAGSYSSGWLLYTEMVQTSKVYVREASMAPLYALLLFGGMHSHTEITSDCLQAVLYVFVVPLQYHGQRTLLDLVGVWSC